MLYVGLTEDHKESATIFANMVGAQVLSQSEALGSLPEQEASSKTGKTFKRSQSGQNYCILTHLYFFCTFMCVACAYIHMHVNMYDS